MIKFFEHRKYFFAFSIAIYIIGLIFLFTNGVTLDLQFKGGTILKYTYSGQLDANAVADTVQATINKDVSSQVTQDLATGTNRIVLSFASDSEVTAAEQSTINETLQKDYPDNNLQLSESNTVSPSIGHRFLMRGILAVALASILIVIYVGFRFKRISGISAGVMALVALLHDCGLVFFAFVIFGIPLNDAFIAVVLTILGYSINDTIVIYDRVRENAPRKDLKDYADLMNTSNTQTLARSINTVLTCVICMVIVLVYAKLYGIDSIVKFALPMAIGLAFGCYSSICIAGPLWVMWQKHKQNKAPQNKSRKAALSR